MKKILLSLLLLTVMVLFCSCDIKIDTKLWVEKDTSGKRVISCEFDNKMINSVVGGLDNAIKKYAPKEFLIEQESKDSTVLYTFTLPFKDSTDYTEKVTKILNYDILDNKTETITPVIINSSYNNILTTGMIYNENFSSVDLMKWVYDAVEKTNGKKEDFTFTTGSNTVFYKNESYPTNGQISISSLKSYNVTSIDINTVRHFDDYYSRTISIIFPKNTMDAIETELKNYLDILSQGVAETSWKKDGENSIFVAEIKLCSAQKMFSSTNKILDVQDNQSFVAIDEEKSTIFEKEENFVECISLANYTGLNGVNFNYTYSHEDDTIIKQGYLYNNKHWDKAGNVISQKGFNFSNTGTTFTFKLETHQTCYPDEIALFTHLTKDSDGNDLIKKQIKFSFETQKATEQDKAKYIKDYFTDFHPSSAIPTFKTTDSIASCQLDFEGNSEFVNETMTTLFGKGNSCGYSRTNEPTNRYNYGNYFEQINLSSIFCDNNGQELYDIMDINYSILLNSDETLYDFTYADSKNNKLTLDSKNDDEILNSHTISVPFYNFDINLETQIKNTEVIILKTILLLCSILVLLFIFSWVIGSIKKYKNDIRLVLFQNSTINKNKK